MGKYLPNVLAFESPLLYESHLWRCAAAEPSPPGTKVLFSFDPENYLKNKLNQFAVKKYATN